MNKMSYFNSFDAAIMLIPLHLPRIHAHFITLPLCAVRKSKIRKKTHAAIPWTLSYFSYTRTAVCTRQSSDLNDGPSSQVNADLNQRDGRGILDYWPRTACLI
jgi:hypothetical protein